MSSERLPPAIDLTFTASRGLTAMLAAAHALAIFAVLVSGIPWPVKTAAIICLTALAVWHVATRALSASPISVCRLVWQSDGECEWQLQNGRFRRGELLPGMLVTPALVVFRVRAGHFRQRTFCIARDAVAEEAMRRLRVRLKVSPPAPPSAFKRVGGLLTAHNRHGIPPGDEKPPTP